MMISVYVNNLVIGEVAVTLYLKISSQDNVDDLSDVRYANDAVLVGISIQQIDALGIIAQDIVNQRGDVSNADNTIVIHITRQDDRLRNNDVKAEGEVIDVECQQIITAVAGEVVGVVIVALGCCIFGHQGFFHRVCGAGDRDAAGEISGVYRLAFGG